MGRTILSFRTLDAWLTGLGLHAAWGLSVFPSLIDPDSDERTIVPLLFVFIVATLAATWCTRDARRRNRPLLPIVEHLMFLFWYVAAPAYLLITRKWIGLLLLVGHLVLLMLTLFVTALIVIFLENAV
jgi:hypothetical protein